MDTCIVETGLLRKKPCGHASITKCANCESPLCAQHAVAQMSAAQKKTGAFMCKQCDDARRQYDKNQAAVAKTPAAPPPAKKAPGAAPAPAAAHAPAAAKAPGKPAEAAKPEPAKADDAPLEFTPSEKKK